MKKKILKFISVIMMIAVLAVFLLILTFINPGSGGFIDLTNVVRYFLVCVGLVVGLIAFVTGYFGWKK
ncbi:hypothetical protein [Anaerotignum sp.]